MPWKHFVLFSGLSISALFAQSNNPAPFPLRQPERAALRSTDLQNLAAHAHVVVELAAPATPETRAALRRSGIELQSWLEGTRYFAAVNGAALSAQSPVRFAMEGVTIYDVDPSAKISSYLNGPNSASWASSEWQGRPAVDLSILLYPDVDAADAANQARAHGWGLLNTSAWQHRLKLRVPRDEVNQVAALDAVRHIQPIAPPYVDFDNLWSAQLMGADLVNTGTGAIIGRGVRVGIWDGGLVSPVVDFSGRLTMLEQYYAGSHATHVAGTLAGDGTTDPAVRGIAPGALLFSGTYYDDVFEKMREAVQANRISISQNSWGMGIYESLGNCNMFGDYTQDEAVVDSMAADLNLSVVFAMGNSRNDGECALDSRAGYYSAGVPASAKNAIAVAASGRDSAISTFSGFGPTRDGRLKPDITALGIDVRSVAVNGTLTASGTSMAAPAISGMLALLTERYRTIQSNADPDAALLKAILLNSARDIGNPGPDYVFGFGIPNAQDAIDAIDQKRFLTGTFSSGEAVQTITVPAGTRTLRVMLTWLDPAGQPESATSLVNDLDLKLRQGDTEVLPMTLDPLNPSANAQPAMNHRDNVEQVLIRNPQAGDYTAIVSATRLDGGDQRYALTWAFETSNVPPCTVTLSTDTLDVDELGGSFPVVVTQSNQCVPGAVENPSGWVETSVPGPLKGSTVVKMKIPPNQTDEARVTMLRLSGRDLHINQTGPCTVEMLPGELEMERFLGILDCYYYGSHAKLITFDAQAGQTVSIQMESGDFDSFLELRGPNKDLVAYDDDSLGGTNSRIPGPTGTLTLPTSGTYTIVATSYYLHDGTFRLKVEFGGPQDPPPADSQPVPITGCPFSADGQLTESSSTDGRRGLLYRTQAYTVQAYAGQRLDVAVTDPTFDSFLYLIAPTGAVAASNDDADTGNGSHLSGVLSTGGQWRIEVTSFAPFTTGSYKLQVQGCPAVVE